MSEPDKILSESDPLPQNCIKPTGLSHLISNTQNCLISGKIEQSS